MLPRIDLARVVFAEPDYLWLLVGPAALLVAVMWRFARRRRDLARLARARVVPLRERFAVAGDLPFWLCAAAATACLVVALARPQGPAPGVRRGGVDLVVLLDASASMRVPDVEGDRWQRSVTFLRVLGNGLSWTNERIAVSLFAYMATPQVRLTRDPNTLFFFLDHLDAAPPYRLEDEASWDTNLELGIQWGLRMIDRDEELNGRTPNATVFVVVSDGQSWSGEVAKAIEAARERRVPIHVVGVGTLAGGLLPDVKGEDGAPMLDEGESRLSRLDRESLRQVAVAGGGEYFELDRDGDRRIANAIIDAGKRLAPVVGASETAEEWYWRFMVVAAGFLGAGLVFLRDKVELGVQLVAGAATLVWLSSVF